MYYWNFPAFYFEDEYFADPNRIFDSIRQKQQIATMKCRLHATTAERFDLRNETIDARKLFYSTLPENDNDGALAAGDDH